MSRTLATLLGITLSKAQEVVAELEQLSGYPAADICMVSRMDALAKNRIAELGLDPRDTTDRELYHSLLIKYKTEEENFKLALGITQTNGRGALLPLIVHLFNTQTFPKDLWVLKRSVAKSLIKSNDPKALMKQLGYRSLDSMLKTRSTAEIFAALPFTQSTSWLKKFDKSLAKLKPHDFETKPVELSIITPEKWEKLFGNSPALIRIVPALGSVLINSRSSSDDQSGALGSAIAILQAISGLRVRSAVVKLQQMQSDFGKRLPKLLVGRLPLAGTIAGQPLSWRSVQYACAMSPDYPLEYFEPHLNSEDLQPVSVERQLSKISPSLKEWKGTSYIGPSSDQRVISMNLTDVALNYTKRREFSGQFNLNMKRALWDELLLSYFTYPGVQRVVLEQLGAQSPIEEVKPKFKEQMIKKPKRGKSPLRIKVMEA